MLFHCGPEEGNEGIVPMASSRRRSRRRSRRSPAQEDFMDSFRVGLGIHFGGASAQGNGELEDISKQADGVGEWINRENPKDKSGPEGEARP